MGEIWKGGGVCVQLELEAPGKASEKWTELEDKKACPWEDLRQREEGP